MLLFCVQKSDQISDQIQTIQTFRNPIRIVFYCGNPAQDSNACANHGYSYVAQALEERRLRELQLGTVSFLSGFGPYMREIGTMSMESQTHRSKQAFRGLQREGARRNLGPMIILRQPFANPLPTFSVNPSPSCSFRGPQAPV